MTDFTLPAQFEGRLNASFRGSVVQMLDFHSKLLGDLTRGLSFFPEYTSHGVDHFQRVLDASASLITKDSLDHFTAEDVWVTTRAVLLHDLAMHLTPEGFVTLLTNGAYLRPLVEMDADAWPELWKQYVSEVGRWSQDARNGVIGDPTDDAAIENFVKAAANIGDLGSPNLWSPAWLRLIGEFVRRHHGRLAHEFSLVGFPGVHGPVTSGFLDGFEQFHDLAGLVARSHTMTLRGTLAYLKTKYHGRAEILKAHPVFLMVLLRIGDYLEVDSSRAPSLSLVVRSLYSPVSRREWNLHESIADVREDEEDDEAILVKTQRRLYVLASA